MNYTIRTAVPGDEQNIRELFIEMLQTIYHTKDVQGYDPGYLDRYWNKGEDRIFLAEHKDVEKSNTAAFRLYERLGYIV